MQVSDFFKNAFDTFVRTQGYTQSALMSDTARK